MSYFTFNGVNSNDLGLIITETPFRPSWAESVDEITIPGRAEVIKNPNGTYDNQSLTINAVISDSSKINDIYSALSGEGKLILSTAPNEYINCRVEPLIPQGVALDMAELPITFDCYPFAYAVEPTVAEIGTSFTEINNTSSVYSAPIIKISVEKSSSTIMKGDVNMNGRIDPDDASLALAEYVRLSSGQPGTFTPEQFYAADMDDDGVLSASDCSAILRLYTELSSGTGTITPSTTSQQVEINTNGASLIVGLPSEVLANGFEVYIDCGLYLIYYLDMEGNMVNIMNYSSLDLPMLHAGTNYMKYNSPGDFVESCTVTINERWL